MNNVIGAFAPKAVASISVCPISDMPAMRIAPFGATCNSLDPGGVLTPLNECVMNDPELWRQIMDETPLKRWATPEEIAEWAYFLTVTNTFCTGQNILVDGGEAINYHFVWKD